MSRRKKILFVCVHNSCRSQIAEGFARHFGDDAVEVYSAGSKPSGEVDPNAIAVMREVGIDISKQRSKSIDEIPQVEYDFIVTMGCGDACPFVPAKHREQWNIPDPKGKTIEDYRKARDKIAQCVKELLASL